MTIPGRWLLAALLTVLGAVVGCASGADDGPGAAASSVPPEDPATRCGTAVRADAPPRVLDLAVGEETLNAAAFGPADATRVGLLLHQVGPFGWCGWARWATLAADAGVATLALDLCGHGESTCEATLEGNTDAQVDGALAELGQAFPDAEEVVLVGSSMGGHLAVAAVAHGADVTAWADVSGPAMWGGSDTRQLAPAVADSGLPGLVVSSPTDGEGEFRLARRLARETGARFVDGGDGHGYELLTGFDGDLRRAGRVLLDFVGR